MRKIVNCKLNIECISEEGKSESNIQGKGYYKQENEEIIVYFTSGNDKYKYEYKNNELIISFNDSSYSFKLNSKSEGEIKNGDFVLKFTTFTSKLEINNNSILVDYKMYQNKMEIGTYKSKLFFLEV